MIRKSLLTLAVALVVMVLPVDADGQGRRRPITNPQVTIDGLIAAASSDSLRVQTPLGTVTVAIATTTEVHRAGNRDAVTVSSVGQYTLTEGILGRDGTITARRVALFDVPASAAAEETVRIEGSVASVSLDDSTLAIETHRGALTISVNATTVIRRDGTPIGLADIALGSLVRVVGKPTGERTLLALQIDVRTTEEPPQRDAVAGEVVEIRSAEQALVVRRALSGPRTGGDALVVVRTTGDTEIYRHRERIRFSEIERGNFLLAVGELDSAGALVARRIDVAERPEPAPRIAGRVLEISTTERTLTVAVERGWIHDSTSGPVTVIANDATKIYSDGEQVRFNEIKAGDFVHVAGAWNAENALVASLIRIGHPPALPPMPLLLGEITAIEPATRTLVVRVRASRPHETSIDGTVRVLVNDDTSIFRNGQPSRFADLEPGEVVSIVGEVRDDGVILAKRIDVIALPHRPGHVGGDVVAVGERSIEIIVPTINPTFREVRVTILVDQATEIYRDGMRVRLSAIEVHDVLAAAGEWKDQDTFAARRIDARSRPRDPVAYVRGTIRAIAPGALRILDPDGQGWAVSVSPLTIIIRDGVPLRFESLVVGDLVDIIGIPKGMHGVFAVTIRVVR